MKKKSWSNTIIRVGLFLIILFLGTSVVMLMDETESLAAVDLSQASVQAVAINPDQETIYMGFTGGPQPFGLSRSVNKGRTWEIVGSGPGGVINELVVDAKNDDLLYAATGRNAADVEGGIWVSDDQGSTWHKFTLGLPQGIDGLVPNISALALDPNHPDTLYVGTEGQGTYKYHLDAENYGYELVGGVSRSGLYVKDIVVGPNSQAYVLTTESLYVLEGSTWRTLETLPDLAISLAVDPADAQTLYAGTVAYGAYRSTDGGMTWQAINEGLGWQPGVILRVSAVTIDETDSQHIALATAYGVGSQLAGGAVYESFDAGQRWTKLADSGNVVPYLVIQEGGVYVATDQGLVRYGDPLPPPAPVTGVDFGSLLHPTNGQMVILILTLLFAALALAGPGNWLPGHRRSMA